MALEKELTTFNENRALLMEHVGEYVLIHEDNIIGYFPSYDKALEAGYEAVGINNHFLVKKIEEKEQAMFFTRDYPICRI